MTQIHSKSIFFFLAWALQQESRPFVIYSVCRMCVCSRSLSPLFSISPSLSRPGETFPGRLPLHSEELQSVQLERPPLVVEDGCGWREFVCGSPPPPLQPPARVHTVCVYVSRPRVWGAISCTQLWWRWCFFCTTLKFNLGALLGGVQRPARPHV